LQQYRTQIPVAAAPQKDHLQHRLDKFKTNSGRSIVVRLPAKSEQSDIASLLNNTSFSSSGPLTASVQALMGIQKNHYMARLVQAAPAEVFPASQAPQ